MRGTVTTLVSKYKLLVRTVSSSSGKVLQWKITELFHVFFITSQFYDQVSDSIHMQNFLVLKKKRDVTAMNPDQSRGFIFHNALKLIYEHAGSKQDFPLLRNLDQRSNERRATDRKER